VATVEEFRRRLRLEVKNLQADDGLDRLQRQRASVRVNTWTDAAGMWKVRGTFDPVTGVKLASSLEVTVAVPISINCSRSVLGIMGMSITTTGSSNSPAVAS